MPVRPGVARSIHDGSTSLTALAALTGRPERRPDLRPMTAARHLSWRPPSSPPLYGRSPPRAGAPLIGFVAGPLWCCRCRGRLVRWRSGSRSPSCRFSSRPSVPPATLLTACAVAALAAGWFHSPPRAGGWWLADAVRRRRRRVGLLVAVTLILEHRLAILPWVHYAALLLAVLASNREPVVRRHLFAGTVDGSPR